MTTTINLQDFLSSKTILHNDTPCEYNNAVKFFIENKDNVDIITYENTRHFSLLNVSVLERDTDGKYFYQFSVKRDGDIIDNIRYESISGISAQLSYYIGGDKYMPEEVDKFVIASSMYHDFQIRVTFLEKMHMMINSGCSTVEHLDLYTLFRLFYKNNLGNNFEVKN